MNDLQTELPKLTGLVTQCADEEILSQVDAAAPAPVEDQKEKAGVAG